MKQYTENQYDDDLTVGTDDYDDSYYTGSVDLFEFSNDEESPISRLKSLILSIDWEITDEILMQFNEELVDLREIWVGEKINLVYVQALEKISKYIYQRKADSHPSAIKLLLTLYHNLEKIVSSFDLTEEQKKEILFEDVKRFESLKRHIDKQGQTVDDSQTDQLKLQKQNENIGAADDLLDLKAIVLGIDWEITDQDLNELRLEVIRLEEKFADSRPRLILLQGIGKLGAYIKLKKSNAHADAFNILHLFYDTLEKIVTTPMKLEEEKAILVPAIGRFNSLKILLGPSASSGASQRDEKELDEDAGSSNSAAIAPAFADLPEEEIEGFQAEEEAKALGLESSGNVDNHVESFFKGDSSLDPEAHVLAASAGMANEDDQDFALQGVDVEEDGDEDDKGVPSESDSPAPALSLATEQMDEVSSVFEGEELSLAEAMVVTDENLELPVEDFSETSMEVYPPKEGEENSDHDFSKLDKEIVLQGVEVETEADDDSDEEALPMSEGTLAPALAENDEVSLYTEKIFNNSSEFKSVDDEIAGTLGGFFDKEIESHVSVPSKVAEEDFGVAPKVDESENDESDSLAPALNLAIEQKDGVSTVFEGEEVSLAKDMVVADESLELPVEDFSETSMEVYPPKEGEGTSDHDFSKLDKKVVLQGVEVETEADDDSDEEALPMSEGELAPALAENDEASFYTEKIFDNSSEFKSVDDEIAGTLGGFFDEEIESHLSVAPKVAEEDFGVAHIVDESENNDTEITVSGNSLASFDSEQNTIKVQKSDGEIEETDLPPTAMENVIFHEEEPGTSVKENSGSIISETELEEDEAIAFVSELKQDKNLDLVFDDKEFEQSAESHLENNQEEATTEIDDQLDSLFDLGEGVEEPEDDKFLFTQPGKTIEDDATVEKDVCPSVFANIEEEEVVFELAEEEAELSDTEFDIGIIGAAEFNELLSSEDDISSSVLVTENENVEDFSENLSATFEINKSAAAYGALRTCVDSLGIELDDKVISGLWMEIDRLQQNLTDKPLEKIFLQLLSTVTRHIDQNRYDSSTDAYVLLQSVCGTLNELYEDDLHQNLEMLLIETHKILVWQEKMLAEQAERNEAELTIGDSILTDQDSGQSDFDDQVQNYEEDQLVQNFDSDELNSTANRKNSVTEETSGGVLGQSDLGEPARLAEAQEKLAGGEDTDILTDDLKQEISTLRQTLQDEIEELRNERKSDSP